MDSPCSRPSRTASATTHKPGVSQGDDDSPWLTYQDRRGEVVYGGKPLGDPPVSRRIKP